MFSGVSASLKSAGLREGTAGEGACGMAEVEMDGLVRPMVGGGGRGVASVVRDRKRPFSLGFDGEERREI